MKWLLGLITLIMPLLPGLARAQDLGDIRLRPSYQRTLNACQADKKKFKLSVYEKSFTSALNDFLQLTTLSPQGVSAAIAHKGLSTFVADFLETDTTWPAIIECMPEEKERRWFLNNMHLSDGSGKAMGLLISAASFKAITGLTQGVYNSLAAISPVLAKRAVVAAVAAGSSYSFYQIKKRIKEQRTAETSGKDIDLQSEFNSKIHSVAIENKVKLEALLKDPYLTDSQRKMIENEIANWALILERF